jgi:hypothetical protein
MLLQTNELTPPLTRSSPTTSALSWQDVLGLSLAVFFYSAIPDLVEQFIADASITQYEVAT